MKLKSLLGKEKDEYLVYHCNYMANKDYNTARKEDGEVEVELDVEKVAEMLNEIEGVKYLESSEDKIDRVHADVMRNNHKVSAQALNDHLGEILVRKEE